MARKLVRWALITYPVTDPATGRDVDTKAFRGETVDLPDALAAKLAAQGAVIDADDVLDKPGQMIPLPEDAGDEEIVNWVTQATDGEIKRLARERPHLAARIAGARETVAERARTHDELLGRATKLAEDASGDDDDDPDDDPDGGSGEPETLADVVKLSVDKVAAYLAEHPGEAQDVLDAETEARNGHPRQGVVNACEVAAQHAAS